MSPKHDAIRVVSHRYAMPDDGRKDKTMKHIEYVDLTAEQYSKSRCTSYTGGAAWIKSPAYPDSFLVIACTPVEIRRYFDTHPTGMVRADRVEASVQQ